MVSILSYPILCLHNYQDRINLSYVVIDTTTFSHSWIVIAALTQQSDCKYGNKTSINLWMHNWTCYTKSKILIQEPYIDFLGNSRAISQWWTIYPTNYINKQKTHSLILINTLISTDSWSQICIPYPNITAIKLHTNNQTIHIFNIYNTADNSDTIQAMWNWLRDNCMQDRNTHIICAGDFNWHHPMWELPDSTHHNTRNFAQPLLQLTANWHMELPAEVPTPEATSTKNHTRPDNIFCSLSLAEHFIFCNTNPTARLPKTDHYSIQCGINITTIQTATTNKCNFANVNWKAFSEELQAQLALIKPPVEMQDVKTFKTCRCDLETAIENMVEKVVEVQKRLRYSKWWFKPKLKTLQKQLQFIAQKSYWQHYNLNYLCHEEHW